MEKNDLEDLTLLDDGHIDYDGLEEMEIDELLELQERLEDNNDK